MKDNKLKKYGNIIYPCIAAAAMLLLWFAAAAIIDKPLLLPTPAETVSELLLLLKSPLYWKAVSGTAGRSLLSFLIAVFSAAASSAAARFAPALEKLLDPVVTVLRAVPTMSIILITLIWLSSSVSPMLIAFLITFPILYQNFLAALKGVDGRLIEMCKVFKVSKSETVKSLYFPAVLPAALATVKSTVSLSLKVTIASEVMAQTRLSMGVYMQQSTIFFETGRLLAWTVSAVLLSYLLELAVAGVEKLTVRWTA